MYLLLSKSVEELPAHKHSATSNNIGSHTHVVNLQQLNSAGCDGYGKIATGNEYSEGSIPNIKTNAGGNHTHTITIQNTGGNVPHQNMPPYISVYIFKRTA